MQFQSGNAAGIQLHDKHRRETALASCKGADIKQADSFERQQWFFGGTDNQLPFEI